MEFNNVELTDEEKKLIDERLEAYYKYPDSCDSWEVVFKRITNKK